MRASRRVARAITHLSLSRVRSVPRDVPSPLGGGVAPSLVMPLVVVPPSTDWKDLEGERESLSGQKGVSSLPKFSLSHIFEKIRKSE